ncbi:MAG TPA: hypothetical protein PJ994_06330 [Tepidiformaceae bacterium]|nr:hypothetical protein [Tepidiformaceae bacterium]HMO97190.1 hypothetical protein [Tepidiformaceae bacterium]
MRAALCHFAAGMALLAGILFIPTDFVRANGVPQLVKLTYLAGVSNYGPQDAEGVLEFSFAEGYARVDVKHLPPAAGRTYEGWLRAPDGASYRVGTITTNSAGIGVLDTKLEGLTRFDYTMFVVAARGPAAPEGAMPTDLSIAGRFTIIADSADSNPGDVRPGTLPDTGEKPAPSTQSRMLRVVLTMLGAASLAFVVIRTRNRRVAK